MKSKRKAPRNKTPYMDVGWREWAELPALKIPAIKIKMDTGARTSALHAYNIKPIRKKGIRYIRFNVHPIQRDNDYSVSCLARLIDERLIKSSNGATEKRYIISTDIQLGNRRWEIEISLTNRDIMSFRMLLGRQAMVGMRIEPKKSYLHGQKLSKKRKGSDERGF